MGGREGGTTCWEGPLQKTSANHKQMQVVSNSHSRARLYKLMSRTSPFYPTSLQVCYSSWGRGMAVFLDLHYVSADVIVK